MTERPTARPPYRAYATIVGDRRAGEVQSLRGHVGGRRTRTVQVLAPRFGRTLTWTLAGAGINDFLQAGFAALTSKANELER